MSKKVFHWLIADTVFAAAVTLIIIWLGNAVSAEVDNETARTAIFAVKTTIWVIFDFIMLLFFLLYWWSDRVWTRVKKRFGRSDK